MEGWAERGQYKKNIPESVQGHVEQGIEQYGLVEGGPAYCSTVGTR